MPFSGKKILCSIDFSEHSNQVLSYSVKMCEVLDAKLIVFHSVPFFSEHESDERLIPGVENFEKARHRSIEKIEKLMTDSKINWEPVVSYGDPVKEAAKAVSETGADLLTAASYGLTGMKRLMYGSLIERLARTVSSPMIVIPPGKHSSEIFRMRKIVTGCDLSSDMSSILQYVLEVAEKFNAELHLVHAMLSPAEENADEVTAASYEEAQQNMKKNIEQRLRDAVSSCGESSVSIQYAVVPGVPGEALAGYSKTVSADLVIVGVRYHKPLDKILIGASTEFLLRHPGCPVLVYPGGRSNDSKVTHV